MEKKTFQPIKLIRSIRYPTYQLQALCSSRELPPADIMKLVILTTLSWLRARFRDLDIPKGICLPEPAAYPDVPDSALCSLEVNSGYVLSINSMLDDGLWVLQLIEPDLGPNPDDSAIVRDPVAGRLFETNISFRKAEEAVLCGFKTVVSEPENTSEPAEVFRMAVVKELVRNPLIDLSQKYAIREEPHSVHTTGQVIDLYKYLRDEQRSLPVVLLFEKPVRPSQPKFLPGMTDLSLPEPSLRTWDKPPVTIPIDETIQQINQHALPFDVSDLAHYRMGYAHFFHVRADRNEDCRLHMHLDIRPGDTFLIEPDAAGGQKTRWSYDQFLSGSDYMDQVGSIIQNCLRGQNVPFGSIPFHTEARLILQRKQMDDRQSIGEIQQVMENQERLLRKQCSEDLQHLESVIRQKDRRMTKLSDDWQNQETRYRNRIGRLNEEVTALQRQLADKDRHLDFVSSCLERPTETAQIPEWVDERFPGRLVLHDRARSMIARTPTQEIEMALVCDALDYLACEYRDHLTRTASEEDINQRCTRKYGRPFDVRPSGHTTIQAYPNEYKIPYSRTANDAPVLHDLTWHLCVGNDNLHLLRIYFFYDKERKLIVVGSLPKHLSILSYQ